MKRLSHFLSQFISQKAEPYGITNAQLNIMFCLIGGESVTQKQLLKNLDVKSSSLTVLLEQLERKGLIDRKLHPDDSRAKILMLSEKGKKFIQQIVVPMGAEMEKDLLKTLKTIRQFMKKNGVIAITIQPFTKGATEETAIQLGNEIVHYMQEAGYSDIRMELKQMKPVATVCVLGINR